MEVPNKINVKKTKTKNKSKDPNIKQINISFNMDNPTDVKLYNFLKDLPNTSLILKELTAEYKLKQTNREEYTKNLIKEYMSTRDFNNNLKASLKSNDMSNFFEKIIEDIVVKEIKNYIKYLK